MRCLLTEKKYFGFPRSPMPMLDIDTSGIYNTREGRTRITQRNKSKKTIVPKNTLCTSLEYTNMPYNMLYKNMYLSQFVPHGEIIAHILIGVDRFTYHPVHTPSWPFEQV